MTKEKIKTEAHRIRAAAAAKHGCKIKLICFISCWNMAKSGEKLPWETEMIEEIVIADIQAEQAPLKMKIVSKDAFYNSGHTFSFYIKRLKKIGCPEDLIILMKETMELGLCDENCQHVNTVTQEEESLVIKYTDTEFYYFNSYGSDFFQRITVNILNGYIDFGFGHQI